MTNLTTLFALTNNPASQALGLSIEIGAAILAATTVMNGVKLLGWFTGFASRTHDKAQGGLRGWRGRTAQSNVSQMRSGVRFNNGTLNSLTARATTRNLGFGRRGRAAYKNKMETAAEHFGQTDGAKATRWEDDVNRAATYRSAAEAQRRMVTDYGYDPADPETNARIRDAIAGVRQSGGFGEARRIQAIQALVGSKTGFDNIEQAYKTVARVGGDNAVLRDSLAGAVHAGSAANGRHDLAPGAVAAMQIAADVAGRRGVDWQGRTMQALEGVDMVSFLRDKPTQTVQYVTQALGRQLDVDGAVLAAPAGAFSAAATEQARERFLRTSGIMDQMEGAKGYAPPVSQQHVNNMINQARVSGHLSDPTRSDPITGAPVIDGTLDRLIGTAPRVAVQSQIGVVPGTTTPILQTRYVADPAFVATTAQDTNRDVYNQSKTPRYDPNNPNNG